MADISHCQKQSIIAHVLKDTVLPWVEQGGMANIFVADSKWHPEMNLPGDMTATRKPLRGKRVPARGSRPYGHTSTAIASWPEEGLTEMCVLKLYFVLQGLLDIQVNDYVLHCPAGYGLLLPPGAAFSYPLVDSAQRNREMLQTLQVLPYREGLCCWFASAELIEYQLYSSEITCSVPHSQTLFYLNQLAEEVGKKDFCRRIICDSLLRVVMALLHREVEQWPVLEVSQPPESNHPINTGHREHPIALAQQYIDYHLREPLSIDRVARYVCMSRATFTARFRAETGKTFAQYTQDLRFEEACKLLQYGDLSIQHICNAVGLTPRWMLRLFHEREGISPLEFRRQSRLKDAPKILADSSYSQPK